MKFLLKLQMYENTEINEKKRKNEILYKVG